MLTNLTPRISLCPDIKVLLNVVSSGVSKSLEIRQSPKPTEISPKMGLRMSNRFIGQAADSP